MEVESSPIIFRQVCSSPKLPTGIVLKGYLDLAEYYVGGASECYVFLRLFHQIMDLTCLHDVLPCMLPSSCRSSSWCTFRDAHPAHTDVRAVSYSLPLVSLSLRWPKGKGFTFLAQTKLGTCPPRVLSMTPAPKQVQLSTSLQPQRRGKGIRPISHRRPSHSLFHL